MEDKEKNQDRYHSDDATAYDKDGNRINNREGVDSDVNTDFNRKKGSSESLTNQESPDTDPNDVDDKASFDRTKE